MLYYICLMRRDLAYESPYDDGGSLDRYDILDAYIEKVYTCYFSTNEGSLQSIINNLPELDDIDLFYAIMPHTAI